MMTCAANGRQARPGDLVTRLGGNEFVLLLPETTLSEALAQAIRCKVAVSPLTVGDHSGSRRATRRSPLFSIR
ncbi:diguanylate cyclase domain-containing protein [Stappia sp. P2PMeth1]|uniref:diguanylate cyclase domain-containing protein n=1 Tax=Stappia sp. P2PMeth1 TaxID=2003586 RepID=UPI001AD902C9